MPLTVGSLFSGIGGIDLGLERAGMCTRWFVEWDAHCQNVLRRHWPGLPVYGDIATVDWSRVEPVDVLAGGFPCQPISAAGKRLAQADDRWLWPEFARAIRELRPRYVLVENVRNLLAVNGGSAFAEVLGDLASSGFDAEWQCIPASAVGAPHRRDRLWLVAYAQGAGQRPRRLRALGQRSDASGRGARADAVADSDGRADEAERGQRSPAPRQGPSRRGHRGRGARDAERQEPVRGAGQGAGAVADTDSARLTRPSAGPERPGIATSERAGAMADSRRGDGRQGDAPASRLPGQGGPMGDAGGQGLPPSQQPSVFGSQWWQEGRATTEPSWWATEPDVGRVAHGVPHRVDRLRALGNAVVPQVVEWVGRRIVAFDEARGVSAS